MARSHSASQELMIERLKIDWALSRDKKFRIAQDKLFAKFVAVASTLSSLNAEQRSFILNHLALLGWDQDEQATSLDD